MLRHHRGITVMTGIGESRFLGENETEKQQYLMLAEHPLLLGVVYQSFPNNLYSTAIITRSKQLGFDEFHDNAFPLFIKPDRDFLDLWLDNDVPPGHPEIADLLDHPIWFTDLYVKRVKTFTGGQWFKISVT